MMDATMLAAAAAFALLSPEVGVSPGSIAWAGGFCGLVVLGLSALGMYRPRLQGTLGADLGRAFAATSIATAVLISARVLAGSDGDVATEVVYLFAAAAAFLAVGRTGMAVSRARALRQGKGMVNTLIVGAGAVGSQVARRLAASPELGLRPIGFLDKEPLVDGLEATGLPTLGASWDLENVARRHDVGHVVVTFSTAPHDVLLRMWRICRRLGIEVSVVPRLFEAVTNRVTVEHLGGIALMRADEPDPRGWRFGVKYVGDKVLATLMLVLTAPVLIAIAIAIRLTSPGPVLYRQQRVGRDGRQFSMLKFRTMTGTPEELGEADARWAAAQMNGGSSDAAPDRRTIIGRFLRAYSLDELPQLLNVFKGDMSIVGPRPERAHYVNRFKHEVHRYGERHRVKAGLTGWAQVNGLRGETCLTDRIEWDNYYIENWSLGLDLKILARTPRAALGRRISR